jgi:hypothetical protein
MLRRTFGLTFSEVWLILAIWSPCILCNGLQVFLPSICELLWVWDGTLLIVYTVFHVS